MRRMLISALASTAVAIALPAAALAHGGEGTRHHHHHHHRHHHARFVHFASHSSATSTTGTSSTPTSPPEEAVGTIASFEGGVLKITLADGTTVSGAITEGTEINCGCAMAMMSDHGGGPGPSGFPGRDDGRDHNRGEDNDQGDDNGPGARPECGTSSLVVGAKVREAELKLSGSQATWESIELAS